MTLLEDLYSRYRGFIFDMDGTLVDSEHLYQLAWGECLKRQGLYFETWSDFFNQHCAGRTAYDGEVALRDHFGDSVDLSRIRIEAPEVWLELSRSIGLQLKPGVKEVIESSISRGFPIGVATSAGRQDVIQTLEPLGLIESFQVIVTGDDIPEGRGKPHPDIFIQAAEGLGVPVASAVIFEDSAAGVRAGVAAGAFVIHIPDRVSIPEEVSKEAALILTSMEGLFN